MYVHMHPYKHMYIYLSIHILCLYAYLTSWVHTSTSNSVIVSSIESTIHANRIFTFDQGKERIADFYFKQFFIL